MADSDNKALGEKFRQQSIDYHRYPRPGKLKVVASKPLASPHDLSLAYSPGVAFACDEIVKDEMNVAAMTSRSNLVAVATNGTAVLGMGDIGPLASKPVMEGKAVLFKKFAGLDCFDIEIAESDPEKFCDIVCSLEPTFGGINLEDIKAPECFYIEESLKKRMKIPVFHDDQHGTAIIVAAGAKNAFELVNKDISSSKIVCVGAGAAGLSCLNMLCTVGAKKENIYLFDSRGIVTLDKIKEDEPKSVYARSEEISLEEACQGADMFLGCSVKGILKATMVKSMARDPVIFALANPDPEILPEDAKAIRGDVIIATGRSDYPNQVNNVLCFPYVFRGALDVGATEINEHMKKACAESIAVLAHKESGENIEGEDDQEDNNNLYGRDNIIPKPFDNRLILEVAPAVALAAMESGVATRPIEDMEAYKDTLKSFVYRSGTVMKPLFEKAISSACRVVFAEGEHPTVLRALQTILDQELAEPILIGRPDVIRSRVEKLGLNVLSRIEICNPEADPRYREYYEFYYDLMKRKGISLDIAKMHVRTKTKLIAMLMLKKGDADTGISGVEGEMLETINMLHDVIGLEKGAKCLSSMTMLILSRGTYFISDTHVNVDPDDEQIFSTVKLACRMISRFGIEPVVGMLSHSNFGSRVAASSSKMSRVTSMLHSRCPDLKVEGELQADLALRPEVREKILPGMSISGETTNLLVMPNIEAANISYNAIKCLADGVSVGPIMLGTSLPMAVVTTSTSVRNLVNMTAIMVNEFEAKKYQ